MPIIIDNKLIETPVKDILNLLKQQLYISRINKLKTIDYKVNNARITCPCHKNGQESKPSCDILLSDKGDIPAGTVHCFTCGYRANIVKFIADCLDITYRSAKEWLLNICNYSLIDNVRDVPNLDFTSKTNDYSDVPEVTLDELKRYDYIHNYMFKRKLTYDIINRFEIGYDKDLDAITFPVYVNGRCIFVAKRRVKFKRFDMPEINPKPIYALDYVKGNEVIVCESAINALTCYTYGREAVALFGTGSDKQIDILKNSNIRHFILALDPDEAGRRGTKRLIDGLNNKLVSVMILPNGKDINDLSREEFEFAINNLQII